MLCNPRREILFLSNCWVGKTHDYRLFKAEFPPTQDWFRNFEVHVDLGFFGIAKEYSCKELSIPHKKPRQKELTEEQKAENSYVPANESK